MQVGRSASVPTSQLSMHTCDDAAESELCKANLTPSQPTLHVLLPTWGFAFCLTYRAVRACMVLWRCCRMWTLGGALLTCPPSMASIARPSGVTQRQGQPQWQTSACVKLHACQQKHYRSSGRTVPHTCSCLPWPATYARCTGLCLETLWHGLISGL